MVTFGGADGAGGDALLQRFDVVFPILHGPFGEDGTVQGFLELANLPYVGAGVLGSALGMDKVKMKEVLRYHGLPVTDWVALRRWQWAEDRATALAAAARFGFPCFVKPSNLGSSVGVSKAHDAAELPEAIEEAFRHDEKILIEPAVDCREIEVAVLGNHHPEASVPGEVVPSNEFYDYHAKYLDGRSECLIPAAIAPEQAARCRALAVQAFLALECAGLARVDFFLDRQSGEVLVNEINTLPGFTPISMYPKLWAAERPHLQRADRSPDPAGRRALAGAQRGRPRRRAGLMPVLPLPNVRRVVAVASGKGGVGKTTVTVNLAMALVESGLRVGVFDADVYGPNVPLLLGITRQEGAAAYLPIVRASSEPYIDPIERFGLPADVLRAADGRAGRRPLRPAADRAPRAADDAGRQVGRAGRPPARSPAGQRRAAPHPVGPGAHRRRGGGHHTAGPLPARCRTLARSLPAQPHPDPGDRGEHEHLDLPSLRRAG